LWIGDDTKNNDDDDGDDDGDDDDDDGKNDIADDDDNDDECCMVECNSIMCCRVEKKGNAVIIQIKPLRINRNDGWQKNVLVARINDDDIDNDEEDIDDRMDDDDDDDNGQRAILLLAVLLLLALGSIAVRVSMMTMRMTQFLLVIHWLLDETIYNCPGPSKVSWSRA
jgi:hypothetical protein